MFNRRRLAARLLFTISEMNVGLWRSLDGRRGYVLHCAVLKGYKDNPFDWKCFSEGAAHGGEWLSVTCKSVKTCPLRALYRDGGLP